MSTFHLVVVGSGGGPDETNLSGYLLKCSGAAWEDGVIGLEAGSTLGTLRRVLETRPTLFKHPTDSEIRYTAARIYSFVQTFVITHAHLDHIAGLILLAGSYYESQKIIMGAKKVLRDIESVFAPGRVWPNLVTWDRKDKSKPYVLESLAADGRYRKIQGDISMRMMPLSHQSLPTQYDSSVFFIRHDPSGKQFLFFGDLEPDAVAKKPQTIQVWNAAAELIPERLDTVFIECSWPSGRDDARLYGHLTPEHLVQELEALALEIARYRTQPLDTSRGSPVRKRNRTTYIPPDELDIRGVLSGLRVFIIHTKYDITDAYTTIPVYQVITEQVRRLAEEKELGVQILHADQGTLIEI